MVSDDAKRFRWAAPIGVGLLAAASLAFLIFATTVPDAQRQAAQDWLSSQALIDSSQAPGYAGFKDSRDGPLNVKIDVRIHVGHCAAPL